MIQIYKIALISIILGFSTNSSAQEVTAKKKSKNESFVIDKIISESSKKLSVITLYLADESSAFANQKVKGKIENGYFEVDLPSITVKEKKSFIDINSPYLRMMAFYKGSNGVLKARLFSDQKAEAIQKSADLVAFKDRLVISIDHQLIKTFSATKAKKEEGKKDESKKERLAALYKQANKQPPKAEAPLATKSTKEAVAPVKAEDSGTAALIARSGEKLIWVSLFFIFAFSSFFAIRPIIRRHKKRLAQENQDSLVNLGSLALAPKQHLSLIQVGREKLLFSVGPEGISLLKDMADHQKAIQLQKLVPAGITGASAQVSEPPKPRVESQSFAKLGGRTNFSETTPRAKARPTPTKKIEGPEENKKPRAELPNHSIRKNDNPPESKVPDDLDGPAFKTELSNKKQEDSAGPESIEDITNLLREKLRNLPKMG